MSNHFPLAAESYGQFRRRIWSQAQPLVRSRQAEFAEDETELQARWFGGEFGRTFTGTEGERIEIVQFGHWNRGAGPDFTEAAVKIDGETRGGAIEVDPDVRDWERHGHGSNPEFNGIVLHVFTDQPALNRAFTRTESHRNVVQLLLPQFAGLQGRPDFLPEAFPGRCLAPLARMVDAEVESLLAAAAQHRLREKSRRLRAMAEATSRDQAVYQGIAEALGYRHNKLPMAVLAQRCPVRELLDADGREREARLFGAAGFLGADLAADSRSDETPPYVRRLWDAWWRMRDRHGTDPARAIRWRVDGMRPVNHPQRRIAALGALVGQWEKVRNFWEEPVNNLPQVVKKWVETLEHPYWNRHISLRSAAAAKPLRLVGDDRLRDLLGNVVFPVVVGDRSVFWSDYLRLRAVDENQKTRRAALRLFGRDDDRKKLFTRYYHQQQGLLQIYEDFCLEDLSECARCPFPEQLLQWREAVGVGHPVSGAGGMGDRV